MPAFISGSPLIDISDYGAVINGSTDDTAAVQAAATAAAGKTLYFPEGTCRVSSVTIPANTNVVGNGPTSIIKQTTLSAGVGSPIFTASNNTWFSALKLDGNAVANLPDAWSDSYNNAAVAGNNYRDSTGRGRGYRCGIRGESITGLTVTNIDFTLIAGACVGLNGSSRVVVSGCSARTTSWELVYAFGATSPSFSPIAGQNYMITNNTLANIHAPAGATAAGFNPDSLLLGRINGLIVANNTLNDIDRDFIKMESCTNAIVAHNTAGGGDPVLGYSGAHVAPSFGHESTPSDNIRICYNTFSGGGWHNGVQINSSDSLTQVSKNIEIDHNTIVGLPYGIEADGTTGLYNLNIHHNVCTSISSAHIDILGGGTGLFVDNNVKEAGVALSNQPTSIAGAFVTEHFYI